jgi:hypothetical protein
VIKKILRVIKEILRVDNVIESMFEQYSRVLGYDLPRQFLFLKRDHIIDLMFQAPPHQNGTCESEVKKEDGQQPNHEDEIKKTDDNKENKKNSVLDPALRPRIIFSGFLQGPLNELKEVAKELGAEVLTSERYAAATHLVMPKLGRTMTMLSSVSYVKHAVSDEWIRESKKESKWTGRSGSAICSVLLACTILQFKLMYLFVFPDESKYQLQDEEFEKTFFECSLSRHLSKPNRNKLFEVCLRNCFVFFCSSGREIQSGFACQMMHRVLIKVDRGFLYPRRQLQNLFFDCIISD